MREKLGVDRIPYLMWVGTHSHIHTAENLMKFA